MKSESYVTCHSSQPAPLLCPDSSPKTAPKQDACWSFQDKKARLVSALQEIVKQCLMVFKNFNEFNCSVVTRHGAPYHLSGSQHLEHSG